MAAEGANLPDIFPDKRLADRYKIVKQLSSGGFSQTFLAEDRGASDRLLCVVKQLKSQSEDSYALELARRLFQTEARVLKQLGEHDQIPYLLDYFEIDQEFYLVLELIEGRSIAEELAEQQLWSETQVIKLLRDILQVLTFVHRQNVIHRDIKPSNLIRRAKDDKIVLIDFGAVKQTTARQPESLDNPTLTITIGTQGYMPNEQIAGQPRFSSDLYALGMIGIQALTGIKPRNLTHDMQTGEVSWHTQVPYVNPKLVVILDDMVRYHFKDRYQTAEVALQTLEELIEDSDSGSSIDFSVEDDTQILSRPLRQQQLPQSGSTSHSPDTLESLIAPKTDVSLGSEAVASPGTEILIPPEVVASAVPKTETDAPTEIVTSAPPKASVSAAPIAFGKDAPSPSEASAGPAILLTPPAAEPKSPVKRRLPVRWYLLGSGFLAIALISLLPTVANALLQRLGFYVTPETLVCNVQPIPALPSQPADYEYIDGTQYYGPVADSLPADGQVIMAFPNGNRYDGEFSQGQRNGCGTFTFENGRRYIGQFKNDKFHGQGIWQLENGARYIGELKNGRCQGLGTYVFTDDSRQRGVWWNGKLLGSQLSCDP